MFPRSVLPIQSTASGKSKERICGADNRRISPFGVQTLLLPQAKTQNYIIDTLGKDRKYGALVGFFFLSKKSGDYSIGVLFALFCNSCRHVREGCEGQPGFPGASSLGPTIRPRGRRTGGGALKTIYKPVKHNHGISSAVIFTVQSSPGIQIEELIRLTSSSCSCAKPFRIEMTTGVHATMFFGLVSWSSSVYSVKISLHRLFPRNFLSVPHPF